MLHHVIADETTYQRKNRSQQSHGSFDDFIAVERCVQTGLRCNRSSDVGQAKGAGRSTLGASEYRMRYARPLERAHQQRIQSVRPKPAEEMLLQSLQHQLSADKDSMCVRRVSGTFAALANGTGRRLTDMSVRMLSGVITAMQRHLTQ